MSPSDGTARTIEEIERDLAAKLERVTANLSNLINEVHPKAVVRRALAEAKVTAEEGLADLRRQAKRVSAQAQIGCQRVKDELRDQEGWRADRLVAVAGGLLGIATFAGVVRHLSGQKR